MSYCKSVMQVEELHCSHLWVNIERLACPTPYDVILQQLILRQHFPAIPASVRSPIHILGIGNLGKLVAHALATLLFHRPELSSQTKGLSGPASRSSRLSARKAETSDRSYLALKPIRHRLSNKSTILCRFAPC